MPRRKINPPQITTPTLGATQGATTGPMPPPQDFTEPEASMWRELVPLINNGAPSQLDYRAIRALCFAVVRYEKMKGESLDEPYTVEDAKGSPKVNPFWTLYKQVEDEMRLWFTQFHMTPAARQKSGLGSLTKPAESWTGKLNGGPPK